MLKANANIMAQGGEGGGCEFLEQIAPSWTSGWSFFSPQKPSGSPGGPLPCFTDHPDHTPLEISNPFPAESEHPSRNKVGKRLWLFIPNTKTLKIFKYKRETKTNKQQQKITCLAIQWTLSKVMASPHSESWHPTSLLVPMVQDGPPCRGSLNKVSSWAAGIASTVNPSRAPGHTVHFYLLCPQES